MTRHIVATVAALMATMLSFPVEAQTAGRIPIGTNVSGLDDWSVEFTLVAGGCAHCCRDKSHEP